MIRSDWIQNAITGNAAIPLDPIRQMLLDGSISINQLDSNKTYVIKVATSSQEDIVNFRNLIEAMYKDNPKKCPMFIIIPKESVSIEEAPE